jgi:uncharacterized membrane protein
MALGMLQLLVIGFEGNQFKGEIIPELDAIREKKLARILDLVFVMKDEGGTVTSAQLTDLTDEEKIRFGMSTGALLGLGAYGPEGVRAGMEAGAIAAAEGDLTMTDEDIEEIAAEVPNNCSALVIFAEMLWSLPLKQAIMNANGKLLGQWIIQPESLVETGAELAAARAGSD